MLTMMAARASAVAGGVSRGSGGCSPALGRRAADLALKLRSPARALCGSLRAAVIALAAIFAVYLLAEAKIISTQDYTMISFDAVRIDGRRIALPRYFQQTFSPFFKPRGYLIIVLVDIVVAASNVSLIFGTITGKLNYLYGWLSLALIDIGVAIATLIWLPIDLGSHAPYIFIFPLVHLWSQLLLVALVHGLAHDLRGGRSPDYSGNGREGGGDSGVDGWLQLNLAHVTPPPPGTAPQKPRSPAVLEPSMCTTAPQPTTPTQHSQC